MKIQVVIQLALCSWMNTASAGDLVGWGWMYEEELTPPDLEGVVEVAGGWGFDMALTKDGSVVAWGYNGDGQTNVPVELSGVTAIAAGVQHAMAVRSDGSVVAWGSNEFGQCDVPVGLGEVIDVSAGGSHSLALRSDGSVVAWGGPSPNRFYPDPSAVPIKLVDVVAIAAGATSSLALKADGTVVAWGDNRQGQSSPPAGLSEVVAIAAGVEHSLALRADGEIVGWGNNQYGQISVPPLSAPAIAIDARRYFSLALQADGRIVLWGETDSHNVYLPEGSDFALSGISACDDHVIGILRQADRELPPEFLAPTIRVGVRDYPFYHAIQTKYGAERITATGLPPGLEWDAELGFISGIPEVSGLFEVVMQAENSWGLGDQILTLHIQPPLPKTWPHTIKAIVNTPVDITLGAIRGESYQIDNLPAGLQWDESTGVISGSPKVIGEHRAQLTVSNPEGSDSAEISFIIHDLVGWGFNRFVEAATVPEDVYDVIAMGAGGWWSFAVLHDGSVRVWGDPLPATVTPPDDLPPVVDLDFGVGHVLAITRGGRVVGWGGAYSDPEGMAEDLRNVVAISAGNPHSVALKSDGKVVAWGGNNEYGQLDVPPDAVDVVAISAGSYHGLALRADGRVVAWGDQDPIVPAISDVATMDARLLNSIFVHLDGTVTQYAWHDSPPEPLSGVVEANLGFRYGLALLDDGTIQDWGLNSDWEIPLPPDLGPAVAIQAGDFHNLALLHIPNELDPPWLLLPPAGMAGLHHPFRHRLVSKNIAGNFAADGLPTGLEIHPESGVISGIPTEFGSFEVTLHAGNAAGMTATNWTIHVNPPTPYVGIRNFATYIGRNFQVELNPVNGTLAAIDGLPEGIDLIDGGNVLEGSLSDGGQFDLRLSLENEFQSRESILSLEIREVLAWGAENDDETPSPADLTGVVKLDAGHSHSMALLADGSVRVWGRANEGQLQVPEFPQAVKSIAAGVHHCLAVLEDGSVAAWGWNQSQPPVGLTNVVQVAGGYSHSLAMKADGSLVGWGNSSNNKTSSPPGLNDVTAIATGYHHNMALKGDGTVVVWGYAPEDEALFHPPDDLAEVVAIAAGRSHCLALLQDGTVVGWGDDQHGQATPPEGLSHVIAIDTSIDTSLALLTDGSVVGWGYNENGQADFPEGFSAPRMIAAGGMHSLALLSATPLTPDLQISRTEQEIQIRWQTRPDRPYVVESTESLNPPIWIELHQIQGDGNEAHFQENLSPSINRYYRIKSP